jgi:hypothetical protein
MNTNPLALFEHRSDAEAYQKRLKDAGFDARIHDIAKIKIARLEVPSDQFERAHQQVVSWDTSEDGIHGAIRCPECKSLRVDFPQYTHKTALPNMLVGFLANIGAVEKEFYCHDCHYTWSKDHPELVATKPTAPPGY